MAKDFHTRKLNLISYIAELEDEKFFKEIEEYVLAKHPQPDGSHTIPFTIKELTERIKVSERDYEYGRIKSQEEIEEESAKW